MTVTLEQLTRALNKKEDLSRELAREEAYKIMNLFGFQDAIPDTWHITPYRDDLRHLEDLGFITTDKREGDYKFTGRYKNKFNFRYWEIHYWVLREDEIKKVLNEKPKKEKDKEIYNNPELWENVQKDRNGKNKSDT